MSPQQFERFVQIYDERFAPRRGPLSLGAQEAVNRYLDCGIFACGFARVRCAECGRDYFVAFSCKATQCVPKLPPFNVIVAVSAVVDSVRCSRRILLVPRVAERLACLRRS